MNKRRDAMLAAAELTLAINRVVTGQPGRQVGTVGRIHAEPGAPNVIPGRVVMSLEIRDLSAEKMKSLFKQIEKEAQEIAARSGTSISFQKLDVASVPALTDERMRTIIEHSAKSLGLSYKTMPSGAGHDAQEVAQIAPTGMIFVPSKGGISHSPAEASRAQDITAGADVLLRTLLALDTMDL